MLTKIEIRKRNQESKKITHTHKIYMVHRCAYVLGSVPVVLLSFNEKPGLHEFIGENLTLFGS